VISVILTATGDVRALGRLLAALVPAAAEGLVREVAVLGGDAESVALADDAGAHLFAAGAFEQALVSTKGPWIAWLPEQAILSAGWTETLAGYLEAAHGGPARLTAKPGFLGLRYGPEGWLAPKTAVLAGATQQDLERLARRSGRRLGVFHRA
jgi:hypothetical protein